MVTDDVVLLNPLEEVNGFYALDLTSYPPLALFLAPLLMLKVSFQ
jgi:hypothetical protein